MTEWGVHWNFYATIYVVNLILVLLQDWLQYSLPFAVAVMIAYEFSIVSLGLKDYVFYGPRNDFVSANREGIVSSFGYLAICLIGIEFGRMIFQALFEKIEKQENAQKEIRLFKKMTL